MKRRGYAALVGVVLAGLLCLALYHYTPASRGVHGSLTLWYSEQDCPRPVMEALLADYRAETRRLVNAKAFPNETALGEAFESGKPDLLLCSHVRAYDLDRREHLAAPGELPPIPASAAEVLPESPGCYWPVGARVPLLLRSAEALPEPPESLEALLRMAGEAGEPIFTATSWSALFQAEMVSLGKEVHGETETDRAEKAYTDFYNALAAAVFAGGVGETAEPVRCVRQGLLRCALVPSTALAGLTGEELLATPLPPAEKGEPVCSAELLGFAFLSDEENAGEARDFLTWLAVGNRNAELALKAGLVPLTAPEGEPETELEALLCELSAGDSLRYLDPDSDYCRNRGALESRLREGLDLLT